MKVKVYIGFKIIRHSHNFASRIVDCISLDRKVVSSRLKDLNEDYQTELKVRTLDTENSEAIKLLW